MKRISLWLALLTLTAGTSEVYGYGFFDCGVRYTPYAFSYHHSGLVSGFAEYTPYAFNYRNSGLVPGYGICSELDLIPAVPVARGRFRGASRPAFRGARFGRRYGQDTSRPVRPPDGVDIIRQHLLAKGIKTVEIDRIFRIGNELVSVDVRVKDRNLLIKYWNPEQIEALDTREQKIYEKYRDDWTRVATKYERNGGQVYCVSASDAQTIVAALDSCTILDTSPETPDRAVMYAKE